MYSQKDRGKRNRTAERKRSSTYVIVIVSYVAVIAVFTVLMAGMFLYSAETITGQVRQSDRFIAERTVQQAAEMLRSLYEHGEMLVQDERLVRLSGLGVQLGFADEISSIMDRANSFTGLTTDLFFCPAGPDMVMNKSGLYTGEELEKLLRDTVGISAEEWRERVSFPGERSFQVVAGFDSRGVRQRNFLMIVRTPDAGGSGQGSFVAGIVPVSMLEDISGAMRPEGYEDIIVEYPDGVYSFGRQELIDRESLEEAERGSTGVFSLLFSGKPVHITACEGRVDDWNCKIHFFCSMEPYRNIVWVCFRNFIISVLVILVLGSLLLWYTLSSRHRSLGILLDRLSGREKGGSPALGKEYMEIDQAIGALQEKQQGMETRLAEYRTRLQNNAVYQLMRGTGVREESLAEFFASQEIDLHTEQCRVLLLALDADDVTDRMEEDKAEAMLKRFLDDTEKCIYRYLPDSCCIVTDYCVECLVCEDGGTDDAEALRGIRDWMTAYCRENNIHFYAAISKPDTGTEGVHRAFLQAETIMDHMTMTGYRDAILDELPEQRSAREKSGQEKRQQQLLDYVNEHYTDASLSVLQMADAFDMSPSSVSRAFRQAAGTGLNTYIHTLRVARAKELIESTDISLKRISEEVGYGNQITMIRAFKKLEGVTPQEYRDQVRNAGEPENAGGE